MHQPLSSPLLPGFRPVSFTLVTWSLLPFRFDIFRRSFLSSFFLPFVFRFSYRSTRNHVKNVGNTIGENGKTRLILAWYSRYSTISRGSMEQNRRNRDLGTVVGPTTVRYFQTVLSKHHFKSFSPYNFFPSFLREWRRVISTCVSRHTYTYKYS